MNADQARKLTIKNDKQKEKVLNYIFKLIEKSALSGSYETYIDKTDLYTQNESEYISHLENLGYKCRHTIRIGNTMVNDSEYIIISWEINV